MADSARRPAIELRRINKRFGAVHANRDVSMSIAPGTVHGIVGENGAGKSTLMSILYGFYEADSGEILVAGKPLRIRHSHQAIAAGIGMVHQHFMLVDNFTVLENVVLGSEGGALLASGLRKARAELTRLESEYGLEVDIDAIVEEISIGLQQRVEILKALYRGAEVLILDEPTGVLTPQEADALFRVLAALRDQGVTVILITHKLREIMAITDTVSVMRQGEIVANLRTEDTDPESLAELMVGRKVLLRVEKAPANPGEPVLEAEDLTVTDDKGVKRVKGISFHVRAGEIVGIAGVSGNGQSELLGALAGIQPISGGCFRVSGNVIDARHPSDAHAMRLMNTAHVPEDRLRMGLVKSFRAAESAILGYHDRSEYNGVVLMRGGAVVEDCLRKMSDFDVRPGDARLQTANFSGGNQQKLVLAREMQRQPDLLLVGQPTRGVDIGAIEFIHNSLIALRDAGKAILLVSVELEEVMSLADRILVMFDGQIVGEVTGEAATERDLGLMMANVMPDTSVDATPAGAGR